MVIYTLICKNEFNFKVFKLVVVIFSLIAMLFVY